MRDGLETFCHGRRRAAFSFALAALLLLGASVPAGAHSAAQDVERLLLSSAPVTLEAPAGRGQWARRLATFADAAAQAYTGILGQAPPAGTIRWRYDAAAARDIDAGVEVARDGGDVTVAFNDPFDILAEDLGVGFAQGYARWITAYSVARLYFAEASDPSAWWIDGAALYMTELLARQERATTPILYNLEAAYTRAARGNQAVALSGAAAGGDAARGKSLATFRLIEALYGDAAAANLLVAAATTASATADFREMLRGALPDGVEPAPEALLAAWLDERAAIDLGLADIDVGAGATTISGTVTRSGAVPTRSRVEVRLANGARLSAGIPAGTGEAAWSIDVDAAPLEVRLDPGGLLPDINRANNRYGFGDAERIRRFFPLDDIFEIGELHFDGTIEQVGSKRAENFSVTLENLSEEPLGLGLLVSAQWIDRPAARAQRRIFVTLPPGERLVARDFVEYPRRGTGRARIEARYWQADTPESLTERLMRDPADLLNSYLIDRTPAAVTGPEATPLERLQEDRSAVASVAELAVEGAGVQTFDSAGEGAATAATQGADDGGESSAATSSPTAFGVRIISPTVSATPLGEMTFNVAVDGPPAALLELLVNDEVVGRGAGNGARATFEATEEQNLYVLRAVAVGADGELATDTRVLERGAIGFGVSVDAVTLNVTVRLPDGGFAEDLTVPDFVVIEDGVEQELVSFSKGEDTAVWAAMLLDNSSSMIGGGIASARAGANRLVDALLRGNDRAMVLGFNDRLYMYSDFSGDVAALRQAIAAMVADGPTSLYDSVVESLRKVDQRVGRRALIVLSDGLDVESDFAFDDVLEYARQSDVLVYTVGLQLMHDATELGDADDVVRGSVENLQTLAEVTGGSAFFPLRLEELEEIYAAIATELESQYSLSYNPTNQNWDGAWRQLEVRLRSGASGVQVRPGYYGVRPDGRR